MTTDILHIKIRIKMCISDRCSKMRSEKFKKVNDRDLAERYLTLAEGDRTEIATEIINRFIDAKAKPKTAKAVARNNIPVIIGVYFGALLVRLLARYSGNMGELLLESSAYFIGAIAAAVFMMIYTEIKNRRES